MASYHITSHRITPNNIASHHATLTSHAMTSQHITSHHIAPHPTILHHTTSPTPHHIHHIPPHDTYELLGTHLEHEDERAHGRALHEPAPEVARGAE